MEVGSVWVQRLKMTVFIFSCCYQDRNWGPIILKSFPCPLLVQVESPRGCCCYQQWFTLVAWNTRIAFRIDGLQKVLIWMDMYMCLCSYFHLSFPKMSTKRTSECLLLLLHICGAQPIVSSHQLTDVDKMWPIATNYRLERWEKQGNCTIYDLMPGITCLFGTVQLIFVENFSCSNWIIFKTFLGRLHWSLDVDDDDVGDVDMYIMMQCLSVCLSRKIITSSCRTLG